MTAHTPGPWNCSQESADPEWWIVTIKGGLIVANVNAHKHQEANAQLISAAPDMLAALALVREFDCKHAPALMHLPHFKAMHDAVFAALAKAEGRT